MPDRRSVANSDDATRKRYFAAVAAICNRAGIETPAEPEPIIGASFRDERRLIADQDALARTLEALATLLPTVAAKKAGK